MGFRFRRRLRLGKGVWINVSKSGTSLSVGGRGATINFGKKGATTTVGIPGTGLSYRTRPSGSGRQSGTVQPSGGNSYSVAGLFKAFGFFVIGLFVVAFIIGLVHGGN